MPFKSEKQKKLVLAAAHNPDFAKKVNFKQSSAKKFMEHSMDEKPKRFKKIKKMCCKDE